MVDKKFRKALAAYCEDHELGEEEQPLLFDNESYDQSIVGITDDNRLIYDYDKMVEEYMADNHCSEEDAIEWIEYNTIRALNYGNFGQKPIIMYKKESIEDIYGE